MKAEPARLWWRVVRMGLLLYGGLTGGAWLVSDRLLFQPEHGSRHDPAGAVRIPLEGGETLAVLHWPNPAARWTLWYFHGNAEDLGDIAPRLQALHAAGFGVFACEYPGYGRSGGRPSEKSVYAGTAAALRYLREVRGVRVENVVLYGSSLGGGPAVDLAARAPVAGLVLQGAFTSAYRVMTRWPLLPFDKFENLRKMPAVRCPVLIMHGEQDEVVAFRHAEELFAAAPLKKKFFRVPTAGHNDFVRVAGPDYWRTLQEFAAGL